MSFRTAFLSVKCSYFWAMTPFISEAASYTHIFQTVPNSVNRFEQDTKYYAVELMK